MNRKAANGLFWHEQFATRAFGFTPFPSLGERLGTTRICTERGICEDREELRELFEVFAKRKPKLRQYYRPGYFTDGHTLIFEYPRNAPAASKWISLK